MLDDHAVNQLAFMIVKKAVSDRLEAMRILNRNPNDYNANFMAIDCENFFHSGYFTLMSGQEGNEFFARLCDKYGYYMRRENHEAYAFPAACDEGAKGRD